MARVATKRPRRDSGKKGGETKPRRGNSSTYKRKDTVNHTSWLLFLETVIENTDNEFEPMTFRGQLLQDRHYRALHRWRKEGSTPTIWTVDDFLCSYGCNFTDFEVWCITEGRELWQHEPPDWWDE